MQNFEGPWYGQRMKVTPDGKPFPKGETMPYTRTDGKVVASPTYVRSTVWRPLPDNRKAAKQYERVQVDSPFDTEGQSVEGFALSLEFVGTAAGDAELKPLKLLEEVENPPKGFLDVVGQYWIRAQVENPNAVDLVASLEVRDLSVPTKADGGPRAFVTTEPQLVLPANSTALLAVGVDVVEQFNDGQKLSCVVHGSVDHA